MKQVYIVTGDDEWLVNIIANKLSLKYSVNLIKVKSNKNNILKMLKIIILIGLIDLLKILIIQFKRKKYKIKKIKKNQLNFFLKKVNQNKIFLVNFPYKINGDLKNIYNCHTSLLPNYKGLLIIQRSIYDKLINNKNPRIGVTIHKLNKDFDDGEIIWNKPINLNFSNRYKFREIYEKFYYNFYYGIEEILLDKKIKILKIKKNTNYKKSISIVEILQLKLRLL